MIVLIIIIINNQVVRLVTNAVSRLYQITPNSATWSLVAQLNTNSAILTTRIPLHFEHGANNN